jgi:hypothetical protein
MQPSTHVTHIPEMGVTESSVRFFVRVAADEFTRENVVDIEPFPPSGYFSSISQATQGFI